MNAQHPPCVTFQQSPMVVKKTIHDVNCIHRVQNPTIIFMKSLTTLTQFDKIGPIYTICLDSNSQDSFQRIRGQMADWKREVEWSGLKKVLDDRG